MDVQLSAPPVDTVVENENPKTLADLPPGNQASNQIQKSQQRNICISTGKETVCRPNLSFYENFNLGGGTFQHFSLPRPQVIPEGWCVDPECHYNKVSSGSGSSSSASGGSTSTAELISSSDKTSNSCTLALPQNHACVPLTTMNSYPYHHSSSNNSIYNNPYSYTTAASTRCGGEEVPYASIRQSNGKIKGRQDNISPATISNLTTSTALSSSRSTLKRQQKPPVENMGTIARNGGGTMSRSARAANASTMYYAGPDHLVVPVPVQACQGNAFCPNCNGNGHVPLPMTMNHLETIPEMSSLKTDQTFWNLNNNLHIPLKRNSSIGGFTITGQPRHVKRSKMSRFCSSHKVAMVVSIFSLLVTIGLIITLLLMKKKGMMENM